MHDTAVPGSPYAESLLAAMGRAALWSATAKGGFPGCRRANPVKTMAAALGLSVLAVVAACSDSGGQLFGNANGDPEGIAYAGGRFHVLDHTDRKVYAYAPSGDRAPRADFDLDDGNTEPSGMAYVDDRFHIVDWDAAKVYAYTSAGGRDTAADFDLHEDNGGPTGITHAGDRFFVLDSVDAKVYAYTSSGDRDPEAEFDVREFEARERPGVRSSTHTMPMGITHGNGRFYVVSSTSAKVYAHGSSGEPLPGADFDLRDDNASHTGIAYAEGRLHVIDPLDDEVHAYALSGDRVPQADFNLSSDPNDHGDDRASATAVATDSETPGILARGDVDWFRVTVTGPGTIEAYTSSELDTVGGLAEEDSVVSTDDDGGDGLNFRLSQDVVAGVYFVRVGGHDAQTTGDYTLHVRFAR